jgi:hypothetical protein
MIKRVIFFSIYLLIFGCGELYTFGARCKFEIKNESDYNVNISFFLKGKLKKVIEIPKGKVYSLKYKDCIRIKNPLNINPDSVIIQFDKVRFIEQYCNGKTFFANFPDCFFKKNFIDRAGYTRVPRRIPSLERIIIDNSDYELAMPL